jgi:hypothetical protein
MKIFNAHVDASRIALGNLMAQLDEGTLEHPIYFSNMNYSHIDHNYTTI